MSSNQTYELELSDLYPGGRYEAEFRVYSTQELSGVWRQAVQPAVIIRELQMSESSTASLFVILVCAMFVMAKLPSAAALVSSIESDKVPSTCM